jgi:hypothetical protein
MPTGQNQFHSQNCCPKLYGFEADKRTKPRPNAMKLMQNLFEKKLTRVLAKKKTGGVNLILS